MTQDEARNALARRAAQLERERAISREARAPVTLQQDSVGRLSRMDAMQQQAMAQAQDRRRQQESARIEAAMRRIDLGEWGYCVTCGDDIAAARLTHDPQHPNLYQMRRKGMTP